MPASSVRDACSTTAAGGSVPSETVECVCRSNRPRTPIRQSYEGAEDPRAAAGPSDPRRTVAVRAPPVRRDPRVRRVRGGAGAGRLAAAARPAARTGGRPRGLLPGRRRCSGARGRRGAHRRRARPPPAPPRARPARAAPAGLRGDGGGRAPRPRRRCARRPGRAGGRRHRPRLEHARRLGARAGRRPRRGGEPGDDRRPARDDGGPRAPGRRPARRAGRVVHRLLPVAAGRHPGALHLRARQHGARPLPGGRIRRRHGRRAERRARSGGRPERAAHRRRPHDRALRARPGDLAGDLAWVAARCSERNVLIAGDFNATIDHLDGLGPAQGRLRDCRDAALATGNAAVGTWPTSVPALMGTPIDHVLATPNWRFTGFRVLADDDAAGSDHRPVLARLAPAG
ncbi:endonuclease/exonuclease/phosphatase family protein [Amnibacterium kyonggiense]